MNLWIYILGEVTGEDIKIGHASADKPLRDRVKAVNREQTTPARYELLAGMLGSTKDEKAMHVYFADECRTDKGTKREYFQPTDRLIEYVNWLRSQWWVAHSDTEDAESFWVEDSSHWLPTPERRIGRTPIDAELIVQLDQDLDGPLAGTPWDWLVSDKAQVQDYYTPPEIVDAARHAMGGIDLDAASHYLANRVLHIPEFFHTGRSAFANDWHGRVWLNPPYGDYAPWFDRIMVFTEIGDVTDVCMLSPTWAFTTLQAEAFMGIVTAHVLLSPTPKFWGNSRGKTGSNHPHSIVYVGERVQEFCEAFDEFGIVMEPPRKAVVA